MKREFRIKYFLKDHLYSDKWKAECGRIFVTNEDSFLNFQ